jgi:hypothetical protein
MVVAKFKVEQNAINAMGDSSDVQLRAVYGDDNPENKEFFKWTPGGSLQLNVVSQDTAAQLGEVGDTRYIVLMSPEEYESFKN